MYRIASVTMFDVLDTVHIAVSLRLFDGKGTGEKIHEFTYATDVQGVGSSEDRVWLVDALVALIEAL